MQHNVTELATWFSHTTTATGILSMSESSKQVLYLHSSYSCLWFRRWRLPRFDLWSRCGVWNITLVGVWQVLCMR